MTEETTRFFRTQDGPTGNSLAHYAAVISWNIRRWSVVGVAKTLNDLECQQASQ
jgi:hypothetical protein